MHPGYLSPGAVGGEGGGGGPAVSGAVMVGMEWAKLMVSDE